MSATAEDVSRETEIAAEFLAAWKSAVDIIGSGMFSHQCRTPQDATTHRQLVPMLDKMRKAIPNRSQPDGIFIGAVASFYNPTEGQKMLTKAGCAGFGHVAAMLDQHRRRILAQLIANNQRW